LRVAVIGDVGGHLDTLTDELRRLGVGSDGRIPNGLTVIQVGDLIHRGPDSEAVVALVDRYLRHQPQQWIQLMGNHEAYYLHPAAFEWPDPVDASTVRLLKQWWRRGMLLIAAGIRTETESFLVTHAGVTGPLWQSLLGGQPSVQAAAWALNGAEAHNAATFASGCLVDSCRPNPYAGPIWASTSRELIPSWNGIALPFSQIHGHDSLIDWRTRSTRSTRHSSMRVFADYGAKHEVIELGGGRIIGVDPCHQSIPSSAWRAFVIESATDISTTKPSGVRRARIRWSSRWRVQIIR
jgi:hypothetical protein